ncbi:protein TIFY 5A-like [Hibiscus syriacus]|uniref:protein TIFY 5A-like n=1 Tax=Hibiscus syriacus TaxID=106335 RepID=UPI001921A547|nr:protein TIFY 5A-like [Hibiscus syriacus]
MTRNCNLELRLLPSDDSHDMMEDSSNSPENHQQQLTIFHNGRVRVFYVTELHARAIIMLANRERDEPIKTPSSPTLKSPVNSPSTALAMKRSLQRFLQKRKMRIQATSPYHYYK